MASVTLSRTRIAAGLMLWSVGAFCSSEVLAQSAELSNSDAKTLIESAWNTGTVNLSIGPITVVAGPAGGNQSHSCGQGLLNENELVFLKEAQAAGIVSIVEEQSSQQFKQGQSFSWGQMLDATTAGVAQKIVIRPTALGQMKDVSATLPPEQRIKNCLKLTTGSFRITNVIRNESHRQGVTDYRTVFLTYNALWAPEYRQIVAVAGGSLADARKAIVLLKNDPFAGKWVVFASDLADADKDFNTSNVASFLANAK